MKALFPTALALLQGPASDSQTVVLRTAFLSTAEAWATIILAVAVLGVLGALIAVLMQLRGLTRSMASVAGRIEKDAAPVLDRARSVAENMEFITAAVRSDVQKVTGSVARLNDRLRQASDRMEERIQDFTALVEVLQEEVEDLALDTAAAVRGVRTGTRTLVQGRTRVGDDELLPTGPDEPALPTLSEADPGAAQD